MTTGSEPRSAEELVRGNSPLAGAEQRILREWIAEWVFDTRQFSTRAQPLVRGDIEALRNDFNELSANIGPDEASRAYEELRETKLLMPAMEVVIAGAQYYVASTRHMNHQHSGNMAVNGGSSKAPLLSNNHAECLRFLGEIAVSVDSADVGGFTAFMRASQTSHSRLDLASVLLELGANVNHRSRFGGVALHEALMAQDRKAVSFLIRNGASMDIRDNDGVSPRDIVALIL